MKKLIYYTGILICTGIYLSSCIAEDMSDCPPDGLVPQFVLVPYEGSNPAIINDSLYSGQIYAFDEQGKFVAYYQISGKPQLNKTFTPNWRLPAGKYNFAAWLNDDERFKVDPCVVAQSTQSQTLLQLIIPQTNIITNTNSIPFLCYGHLNNKTMDSKQINTVTIPVMQYTNRINLTINGLSNIHGKDYSFSIRDNNGSYGFDGMFASDDFFTYSTTNQTSSDILITSLTVLKLSRSRPNPILTIKSNETGKEFSAGLVQMILSANPDNDFDKTHIYNISMSNPFDYEKEIPLTITINGWVVDQSNVDLNIN